MFDFAAFSLHFNEIIFYKKNFESNRKTNLNYGIVFPIFLETYAFKMMMTNIFSRKKLLLDFDLTF